MVDVVRHISWRAWFALALLLCSAGALGLAGARAAMEPPWAVLARIDQPGEATEASAILDRYGIRWSLRDRGQVLAVERRRRALARQLVAGTLLPARSRPSTVRNPDPVAARMEAELNGFLADVLGPGRAYVSAAVVVDRDRRAIASEAYGPRRTARALDREAARLSGDVIGGRRLLRRTTWAVDRRITRRRLAGDRIDRVSLALVVDRRLGGRKARALGRVVATAAGLDASRGDRIALSRMRLRGTRAARARAGGLATVLRHPLADVWLARAPWALLIVGVLLFVRQVRRDVRDRPGAHAASTT